MKIQRRSTVSSVACAVVLAITPLSAWAVDELPPEPPQDYTSPVIITEVQTGAATASDEFIELYNTSNEAVDISGWQLRTAPVAAAVSTFTGTSAKFAIIERPGGGPVLLGPGAYYVLKLATADAAIPADQAYTSGLTKTEKALALFAPNEDTCKLEVRDAVAWVAADAAAGGEGRPLVANTSKDILLVRYQDEHGQYVDVNDNLYDFFIDPEVVSGTGQPHIVAGATPGAGNGMPLPPGSVAVVGSQSPLTDVDITDCEPPASPEEEEPPAGPPAGEQQESPPAVIKAPEPESELEAGQQPVIPAGNIGLKAPMLSEFLPNPAPPQIDKNDEFIELYNPNDAYFDLSGYILEVGLTTKRRYTIPVGTKLPPKAFLAFFSAQTRLALSNSGGQVALLDPLGRTLAVSEPYGTAKDGQAWVFANGIWQWTTKPTPNALNVVSAPAVKSKATTKKSNVSTASSTKAGAGSQSGSIGSAEDIEGAAAVAAVSSTPLHPGVLALIALSAVLYCAYEYRRDVANHIHRFRTNRAARRALRQGAERG